MTVSDVAHGHVVEAFGPGDLADAPAGVEAAEDALVALLSPLAASLSGPVPFRGLAR